MTKLGRFFRETVEKKLKEDFKKSESLFLIQYAGLSSVQMTLLRNNLKHANSRLFVTKNSLMRRVLKDVKIEGLESCLAGPTAVVFTSQDITATSKVLIKFAKENTSLNLSGAFFQNRVLNKKDIEAISALPSKEALRAQIVMLLKSPLTNLVYTLKGNLNKLVIALNQIKEKKESAK